MVAQAIQDCGDTGRYYCEYRDKDEGGTDSGGMPISLRPKRVKDLQITITNRSGQALPNVRMGFSGAGADRVEIISKDSGSFTAGGGVDNISIGNGDTKVVNISIKGVENYVDTGNAKTTLQVWTGLAGLNNLLGEREFTIVEDDNRAYIGRRNYHPYGGGAWPSSPCCFTESCAFSANACTN